MGLAKEYGVDFLTYEGEEIITNNDACIYAHKESKINHLTLRQVDDMEEHVNFPVAKFLLLDDGDYLATVEPKVKAAMGKNFAVYRSEPYFLEVLPKGIDKAQSLERLLQHLGMTKEEMIACGDGYNDLTMIQYAGLGVAMENAVLPVRKAADYITASNNEDGVGPVSYTHLDVYKRQNVDSTVDELEKGKSLHGTIDSAEFTSLNGQYSAVFSGEGYLRPLEGDIEPLEGETFDIFAASEEEWNAVAMEMAFGVFGLAAQISQ